MFAAYTKAYGWNTTNQTRSDVIFFLTKIYNCVYTLSVICQNDSYRRLEFYKKKIEEKTLFMLKIWHPAQRDDR